VNRPAPQASRHTPPDTDLALVVEEPGRAAVRPVPATDGPVTVRTRYTGLSAGTELSFLTGTNPALTSSFDPELGLFRTDRPGAGYPVERLGYMEVAEVTEAPEGLGFAVGDTVAMTYGHRTGYRADPLRDRIVPVPPDLDPLLGIYVAHMGPICANGLLHAAVEEIGRDVRSLGDGVRGRRVAVVGVEGQVDDGALRPQEAQRERQGGAAPPALEHQVRAPVARSAPPARLERHRHVAPVRVERGQPQAFRGRPAQRRRIE